MYFCIHYLKAHQIEKEGGTFKLIQLLGVFIQCQQHCKCKQQPSGNMRIIKPGAFQL